MLSVILLSFIMLSFIMLSFIMLCFIKLRVIMLSVIMLSFHYDEFCCADNSTFFIEIVVSIEIVAIVRSL
jgi:hypothetical protein